MFGVLFVVCRPTVSDSCKSSCACQSIIINENDDDDDDVLPLDHCSNEYSDQFMSSLHVCMVMLQRNTAWVCYSVDDKHLQSGYRIWFSG